MTKKAENLIESFERSMKALETVVARMESGELSLEESLQCFESGIKLTRECQQALAQAEQRVQILMADNETLVPFDDHPADTPDSKDTE